MYWWQSWTFGSLFLAMKDIFIWVKMLISKIINFRAENNLWACRKTLSVEKKSAWAVGKNGIFEQLSDNKF